MLKHYLACGNGFLVKMRNSKGEWVGLERLLPSEVQIIEQYDDFGFFRPDYIQVKNNKKTLLPGADVIHLKMPTIKSEAWGLACLPVLINIELLSEIKLFDYNNFRNGLLIDYIMIVEGGTLHDEEIVDEAGNVVFKDTFAALETALKEAKGNNRSHSVVLLESEDKDVKIRLEPLRQQDRDGGFLKLKKDLREGIFAYHRVPPRLVSQLVAGQLGGDNRSDMTIFYNFVVNPLQMHLAEVWARVFNQEFKWGLSADDFQFGVLTEVFETADEKLFNHNKLTA